MTLDDVDRQIRLIQKKIRMFQETGDLRRLSRLKVKLAVLQADLKKVGRPVFRKSYAFEAWCEELAAGRRTPASSEELF
jgi:hypothetical protein